MTIAFWGGAMYSPSESLAMPIYIESG